MGCCTQKQETHDYKEFDLYETEALSNKSQPVTQKTNNSIIRTHTPKPNHRQNSQNSENIDEHDQLQVRSRSNTIQQAENQQNNTEDSKRGDTIPNNGKRPRGPPSSPENLDVKRKALFNTHPGYSLRTRYGPLSIIVQEESQLQITVRQSGDGGSRFDQSNLGRSSHGMEER